MPLIPLSASPTSRIYHLASQHPLHLPPSSPLRAHAETSLAHSLPRCRAPSRALIAPPRFMNCASSPPTARINGRSRRCSAMRMRYSRVLRNALLSMNTAARAGRLSTICAAAFFELGSRRIDFLDRARV